MSKKKKKLPIHLANPSINNIDFTYQKVVSYSQYLTWKNCNHKWFLTSVEKKYSPPNINMVFGTAIHYILQHYIKEIYATSGTQADKIDLNEIFETKYIEEYKLQYESNKNQHFSNPVEMREFYNDGIEILNWFKKNRSKYFTIRNSFLVGIETPLQIEVKKNIIFVGYIDMVIYDQDLDKITIYDFKTSTKGWNKWNKKDDTKLAQILLYKKYFSDLYQYPIDKIDVKFIILKRKIEPTEYQEFPKRIQEIVPIAGKTKIKQATDSFNEFLKDCFDDNGTPIRKNYTKNISKLCSYCIFNNTSDCIKEEIAPIYDIL